MPELPEVETVRSGLKKLIIGKKIILVDFDWPKSFPNSSSNVDNFLIGSEVIDIKRRGKALIIDLSTGYSLVCHLKMTGQIVFVGDKRFGAGHPNDSLIGKLPDKSTRVTLTFSDKTRLYFNDQRKFGWMRLVPTIQIAELDFFKKIGPEPLAADFNSIKFSKCLDKRKNSSIKAALLDQTVIAGVGNIYADESLWGAMIHPTQLVKDLIPLKRKKLFAEVQFVLNLAIKKGGSTDRNYVNAEGKKGSYMSFARVFRREGQACPRCHEIIQKSRVASRGTHFCPNCQKVMP